MIVHFPEVFPWVVYILTLLVPSPLALLKGVRLVSIIPTIQKILTLIALFITIAEDATGAGTGAEKKAKVIADIKIQLPTIAESLGIPSFVVSILTNDQVLSVIIDLLVGSANAAGTFVKAAPVDPTKAPAS